MFSGFYSVIDRTAGDEKGVGGNMQQRPGTVKIQSFCIWGSVGHPKSGTLLITWRKTLHGFFSLKTQTVKPFLNQLQIPHCAYVFMTHIYRTQSDPQGSVFLC